MSKKTKLSIAIFSVIFCLSAFWVGSALKTNAQSGPVISNITINKHTDNFFSIYWLTDVTATGKIDYGKTSGNYTESLSSGASSTTHIVYLNNLDYSTQYFFKISATDAQNQTIQLEEQSFTTGSKLAKITDVRVNSGYDKAVIEVEADKAILADLKYGTAASSLTKEAVRFDRPNGGNDLYPYARPLYKLENLQPQTTYYYQVVVTQSDQEAGGPTTEVKSFTTTGLPSIDSLSPESGPTGSTLTINGKNFGEEGSGSLKKAVAIGCDLGAWPDANVSCLADLVSWSNTKIVVKIKTGTVTGKVTVAKTFGGGYIVWGNINLFTIKGPTFTLIAGTAANTNTSATVSYVSEAYGCKYSTTNKDSSTVQVKNLFTSGSDTDKYLKSVYDAYYTAWNRYPRCDELQFHLDHATPIERLKSWLAEYSITEKYGCQYSLTVSDENTVRLPTLFKLDSTMDKYLNAVYNAYYEAWGRYPRCDELEFQATHSTPIERLKTWLAENAPKTNANVPQTINELTGAKIEFTDSGTALAVKSGADLIFDEGENIIFTGTTVANSTIILTVASETSIYTAKSDTDGNWAFALPGPLDAGNHTVKVAVFNDNGEKLRESETISFSISAAEAVFNTNTATATKKTTTKTNYWLCGGLIAGAVVLLIILLAVVFGKKKPAAKK